MRETETETESFWVRSGIFLKEERKGGEETDFGLVAAQLQFPFFPMKKLPSKELDDGFCELGFSQSLKKFGIWNFWC